MKLVYWKNGREFASARFSESYVSELEQIESDKQGELLFAEYGLSGIPIFQISRFASKALYDKKQVTCSIDLLPQFSLHRNCTSAGTIGTIE